MCQLPPLVIQSTCIYLQAVCQLANDVTLLNIIQHVFGISQDGDDLGYVVYVTDAYLNLYTPRMLSSAARLALELEPQTIPQFYLTYCPKALIILLLFVAKKEGTQGHKYGPDTISGHFSFLFPQKESSFPTFNFSLLALFCAGGLLGQPNYMTRNRFLFYILV